MKTWIVLALLLIVVSVVGAQDETPELLCSQEILQEVGNTVSIALSTFQQALTAGDTQLAFGVLLTLDGLIDAARSTCNPLTWSGSGDTVLGPVFVDTGVYRATFTTAGFGIVSVSPLVGSCGSGTSFLTPGLFSESRGEATDGAEAILSSQGCSALLEISNVQEPWELVFDKVG